MTEEMGVVFSISAAFIIAGAALKVSAETGEMVLIEHLKEDWICRMPFRLRYNRYIGFSRTCYQLFVILYYTVKALAILALCVYYWILAGLCILVKWLWRRIVLRCSERE